MLESTAEEFRERISLAHPDVQLRDAFGASNGPFGIHEGFRLGLYNLNTVDLGDPKATLGLVTRLFLPHDSLLYVAVIFAGDSLSEITKQRERIVKKVKKAKADLVRVYLMRGGACFDQSDYTSARDLQRAGLIRIRPVRAYFADMNREALLSGVVADYASHLADLLSPVEFLRLASRTRDVAGM